MNNKFCILPWISLSIGTDGQIHPCCQTLPFDEPDLIKDFIGSDPQNTPQLKKLRNQFLKGECPKVCEQCFCVEESGAQSMRMIKNKQYSDLLASTEFIEDHSELLEFDVRLSNVCQLSCLTCEPLFSTSWYQYQKDHPLSKNKKVLRSLSNVDEVRTFISSFGSQFKLITMSGGEPLLEPLTIDFLKLLDDKSIEININTGLMLSEKMLLENLEEIKKFHSRKIAISVDSIGQDAEEIRRGLNWEVFLSNLDILKNVLGEEDIYFQITCSNLNAGKISEVLSWIHDNYPAMLIRTTLNFVLTPDAYSPKNASVKSKDLWISTNNKILKEKLFSNLCDEEYHHVMKLISMVHNYIKND